MSSQVGHSTLRGLLAVSLIDALVEALRARFMREGF
jgi:hypothetical protein